MNTLDYLIWYHVPAEDAPSSFTKKPWSLNYKTGLNARPQPQFDWVKGEPQSVKYFARSDAGKPVDLMLSVDFTWLRNDDGLLIERLNPRRWTVEGSTDEQPLYGPDIKLGSKIYTLEMADKADTRRRKNIIAGLKSQAAAFGATKYNQTMFDILASELFSYEESGSDSLVTAIGIYQDPQGVPWLEAPVPGYPAGFTVRAAIIAQLDLSPEA